MILTICPYYKTGRKCTHEDYCCDKIGNNCMSDTYYAKDLERQLQLEKDNVLELNELLISEKEENARLKQVVRNIKDIITNRIDYENFIGNIIDELKEVEE